MATNWCNLFPVYYAEPKRDRLRRPYEGAKPSSGGKAFASTGHSCTFVNDIRPAAEIVRNFIREAEKIIR